jgi:hypothetical protein
VVFLFRSCNWLTHRCFEFRWRDQFALALGRNAGGPRRPDRAGKWRVVCQLPVPNKDVQNDGAYDPFSGSYADAVAFCANYGGFRYAFDEGLTGAVPIMDRIPEFRALDRLLSAKDARPAVIWFAIKQSAVPDRPHQRIDGPRIENGMK